jgi:hypothetical protein
MSVQSDLNLSRLETMRTCSERRGLYYLTQAPDWIQNPCLQSILGHSVPVAVDSWFYSVVKHASLLLLIE